MISRPSGFFRGLVGAFLTSVLLGSCGHPPSTSPSPAPTVSRIYGLTDGGELVSFGLDQTAPEVTSHPITGLGGQTLVDIDVRPEDGELYGITSQGTVYHLNPATGEAVADGAATGRPTVAMDFDPAGGRLRVLGTDGELSRLTLQSLPTPPALLPPLTDDGLVAYSGKSSLPAQLVALAHSQSYDVHSSGAYPPQAPTLYSIDAAQNALVMHTGGPQFSALKMVATLGQKAQPGHTGFDIAGADLAYVSLSDGQNTALYATALTPPPVGTRGLLQPVETLKGISLKSIALALPVR